MAGISLRRQFINNVGFSVIAQLFTLLQSMLMSIVVAKLVSVEVFAYWQIFLFYSTYVGYLCFGSVDGIYLRLGGAELATMDPHEVGPKWKTHSFIQLFFAIVLAVCILFSGTSGDRVIALSFIPIYLIINNCTIYLSQLLTACNLVEKIAKAIIVEKILSLTLCGAILIAGYRGFILFIVIYCVGKLVELAVCLWVARYKVFNTPVLLKDSFVRIISDCKVGIFLTLSTLSSVVVTGVGRFLVDVTGQGLETFAYMSFAFSMISFFLMFLRQIGTSVFPLLRRLDSSRQSILFSIMRSMLSMIAMTMVPMYGIVSIFLNTWMPTYSVSITYFLVMLPVFMFDAYMQVIYTPYLTALRKERHLLLINAAGAFVTALTSYIALCHFESVLLMACCTSLGMGVKSVGAYMLLSHEFGIWGQAVKKTIVEIVLVVLYIGLVMTRGIAFATFVYLPLLVLLLILETRGLCSNVKMLHMNREQNL